MKAIFEQQYKDNQSSEYLRNPDRKRLLELLLSGRHLTVLQIAKDLNIPDPRSHIRYIRKAGFNVASVWHKTSYERFKIYFLK